MRKLNLNDLQGSYGAIRKWVGRPDYGHGTASRRSDAVWYRCHEAAACVRLLRKVQRGVTTLTHESIRLQNYSCVATEVV